MLVYMRGATTPSTSSPPAIWCQGDEHQAKPPPTTTNRASRQGLYAHLPCTLCQASPHIYIRCLVIPCPALSSHPFHIPLLQLHHPLKDSTHLGRVRARRLGKAGVAKEALHGRHVLVVQACLVHAACWWWWWWLSVGLSGKGKAGARVEDEDDEGFQKACHFATGIARPLAWREAPRLVLMRRVDKVLVCVDVPVCACGWRGQGELEAECSETEEKARPSPCGLETNTKPRTRTQPASPAPCPGHEAYTEAGRTRSCSNRMHLLARLTRPAKFCLVAGV